ncbi:DUF1398 domain-containing protein [Flectobacillus longus]|uniref:DUF1398 domain-containing protein n=1 Tax=Flectobacillus longus TaxID=2984207 RepID=UPI0024B65CA3|nr:DUF1398 family protein [Flectobacillus longus]MDI9882282.1 DUF1398 family protein [Flectobacillus longus]
MFTVKQIKEAHAKVKSGADFPLYIQEIKAFGVIGFETWVNDSHTNYWGKNNFETSSEPVYDTLIIEDDCTPSIFAEDLKAHQAGKTDYYQFCKDCAKSGIEKWIVSLEEMTCIYYDKKGNQILVETIPS